MKLRHSLILSMVLHLCLFAAVLLFSADLLGRPDISGSTPRGSNKMSDENVLFVKLLEDISKSGKEQPVSKTGKPKLTKSQKIETEEGLALFMQNQPVSDEPPISQRNIKDNENYSSPIPLSDASGEGARGRVNDAPSYHADVISEDNNDLNTLKETAEDSFLKNSSNEVIDVMSGSGTDINVYYSSFSPGGKELSGGGKDKGVLSAGIIEIIKNSIERAKTYPLLAKKRGIEGTVYVSFSISPQGEPRHLKILKSSGSSILDTATLDILKKAAPFPYVDVNVEVPVVFKLNN